MSSLFFDNFTSIAGLRYPVYGDKYYGAAWKVGGKNEADEISQPNITHVLTSIKILIYRKGNPGTVTMEVKQYDNVAAAPIGGILSTGSFDGDSVTDNNAGEIVDVQLTNAILYPDVWYCYYIKAPTGDDDNCINLKIQYEE